MDSCTKTISCFVRCGSKEACFLLIPESMFIANFANSKRRPKQIRRDLGLSSIELYGERTRSTDHNVTCPKYSNKGVYYHTQQARSVDDGQTMFYKCPNYGHNFRQHMMDQCTAQLLQFSLC
uniref:DNA-directed RNA polymerase I subunit RPA12-like n=1 Tax=Erigeron canadensis TaxID=72917 RepID=UPI001CB925CB|nr:DNA-directed RNA polymerase I subunit RPA12-like [Erigeron canadensis]XP_043634591.1 DNA-directed RNA polymerase I subunit RPA12-like [Erigeron canadensis]